MMNSVMSFLAGIGAAATYVLYMILTGGMSCTTGIAGVFYP